MNQEPIFEGMDLLPFVFAFVMGQIAAMYNMGSFRAVSRWTKFVVIDMAAGILGFLFLPPSHSWLVAAVLGLGSGIGFRLFFFDVYRASDLYPDD